MRKIIFTLMLTLVSSVWMTNEASNWCMPAAQTSTEQPIRIGGTFQTDIFPCVDETEPCPPCLTIVLASGGHYYLVSDDPQVLAILDTISTESFAIIEGNHYLEGHYDFIHVSHIFFPETDITQLTGEWEVYKETVSTPTGDAGTRWFSTHDVNNTNYIIENNSIYKVVLDQASGYAHYSDIVPYSIDKKENGTWLLTAEGMFSSSDPVGEGIPTPVTIYKLTENEIEWMYAANGGDEGPSFYYQYLRRNTYAQNDKLPSLCDEWNVLHEPFSCYGIYCRLQTLIYRLTTDTLIQDVNYVKLMEQEGPYTHYKGAMREGTNRDIYYIPADSTHEYLLYAFDAQVGDTLSNLWVGGFGRDYQGVVQAISNGSPRIFTIGVKFGDESDDYLYPIRWIEGVGSPETPMGMAVVPDVPADVGVYTLLCAYKNGEQVYSSSKSERYGCEFNGIPSTKPYSLCDTWNVMEVGLVTSPEEIYHTVTQRLTKDTIIAYPKYYNFRPYARLEENGKYKGAMREEGSGVIYYIPAGSTHEYLLYKFNAKVGDRLTNLWYGGDPERCPNGYKATVLSISDETPRVFTVEVEYIISDSDGEHIIPWTIYWTEGVGLSDGPAGQSCPGPDCACSCGHVVLCAYKNGEQVYVSEMGEKYGCEYNYDPFAPSDTIPLYTFTGDDPGSSTVDPVDPNQVVAMLKGDELTIKESSGETITYQLSNTSASSAPGLRKMPQSQTFQGEISVTLTEEGNYSLILTNPGWNYRIVGRFEYPKKHQGIDPVAGDEEKSGIKKVLRNGQIVIERNGKRYNLLGGEL